MSKEFLVGSLGVLVQDGEADDRVRELFRMLAVLWS